MSTAYPRKRATAVGEETGGASARAPKRIAPASAASAAGGSSKVRMRTESTAARMPSRRPDASVMGRILLASRPVPARPRRQDRRSEEHTAELQSLMRISYAVFCLKQRMHIIDEKNTTINTLTR